MEKLVLIDGNSLINRAFYAMPLLTTKDGVYTNAVYGFMNMFIKMLTDEKPSHVAVAFDLKAPTFRHKMYGGYKATRKPMPQELRPQVVLLKEVLNLMGVATVEKEGYEADDIIGTIATKNDVKTIIITGDRDSFQLVNDTTEVHFTKRGLSDVDVYNAQNFVEKYGVTPLQVIELKSLMGDSSDNIPGAAGVGEKTARDLIAKYSTVDNLYDNVEEISGKLKDKLVDGKDTVYLSHTLATIDVNAPIDFSLSNFVMPKTFSPDVKQKFIELEFKSLYKKEELFGDKTEKTEKSAAEDKKIKVVTVSETDKIDDIPIYSETAVVVFDNAVNLYNGKEEYRLPLMVSLLDDGFSFSDVAGRLKNVFTGDNTLIVYDKKGLMHKLFKSGVQITAKTEDVSLLKYLGDYSGSDKTVSDLIEEYGKDKETPAFSLYSIYNYLKKKVKEQDLTSLYYDVELPLIEVLFSMEQSGFKVDINALEKAGEKYFAELDDLEKQIRDIAGDDTLNVNSPRQLGEVLFEKLKIGKGKKTKTGYSTSAEVLESLEGAHPIIPLILKYRSIQKLSSTYVEGLKPQIDKSTGLIHTSFMQNVTATGRLSSKEPNLQNIPVRDEEGRELRKFFVPKGEDRILIGGDYSQIELRLLAAFSGEQSLIDAFNGGEDIHAQTAAMVFNVDVKDVTKAMRSEAKAVNFGIIYGISEYGLAKNLKIAPAKAKEYISSYYAKYPLVRKYIDDNVKFAYQNGYALTYLKRRRYIRELNSSNYSLRQFGERVAMNMPLQGSSADIIKLAMLGVYRRLQKEGLKSELILQIHDELIVDAYESEKEQVIKILKEEMENAVSLKVKLTVETGCGKTWFEAK